MECYEAEVALLLDRWRNDQPAAGSVVFYGSSSIRLWDTLADDFPGLQVVNAGFGGSTLAACAHFCRRLVLPLRPRGIAVYAGDNDLGDGRSPRDVLDAWRDLVGQIDALGPIPLLFLSIKPSPARWSLMDRIHEANAMVRQDLLGRGNAGYVDLVGPMFSPDGQLRTELYADDGLHLSRAGYRLWQEIIAPHCGLFG